MAARCQLLAVVTALIGQLIGVAGLPLPTSAKSASPSPTVQKIERKCCCACGGGCGPCCCCCSGDAPLADSSPAEPPAEAVQPWHWVARVQVQACFGVGPAGFADLPPGLPMDRSVRYFHVQSLVDLIHLSPINSELLRGRPPTPPPRTA